jgi:hypothetical protein
VIRKFNKGHFDSSAHDSVSSQRRGLVCVPNHSEKEKSQLNEISIRRNFKKSGAPNFPAASIVGLFSQRRRISMQNPTKKTSTFGRTAAEANAENSSEAEIRRRAYELYEARGRGDGHDVEDWLEAEVEITGRSERAAA